MSGGNDIPDDRMFALEEQFTLPISSMKNFDEFEQKLASRSLDNHSSNVRLIKKALFAIGADTFSPY